MSDTVTNEMHLQKQLKLIAIIFAILVALLAVGYFIFMRYNFVNLYQGLPPQNAAAIVEELSSEQVRFKLRNRGEDILVPATQVNEVRLGLEGARAPLKEIVGFEIFNESQMGLTDFAQKIKYQRALQGELARTILMMEGIENARVHIAIPDKALFRGNKQVPTAAVTIVSTQGKPVGEMRISGIQKLVAASVSELDSSHVVVLNETGKIISQPTNLPNDNSVLQEQVDEVYIEQLTLAFKTEFPDRFVSLKIYLQHQLPKSVNGSDEVSHIPVPRLKFEESVWQTPSYRIVFLTKVPLSNDEQHVAENILREKLNFSGGRGDVLLFKIHETMPTTPVNTPDPEQISVAENAPALAEVNLRAPSVPLTNGRGLLWLLGGLVAMAILGVILVYRRRQQALTPTEYLEFAEQLKSKIQAYEERASV